VVPEGRGPLQRLHLGEAAEESHPGARAAAGVRVVPRERGPYSACILERPLRESPGARAAAVVRVVPRGEDPDSACILERPLRESGDGASEGVPGSGICRGTGGTEG